VTTLVMMVVAATAFGNAQQSQAPSCRETVVTGHVQRGEAFEAALTDDLMFRLVPQAHPANPQGWTIQISPDTNPDADYLMVATPPYRFSNPRYVDTGYGITAEAALAWTPREFAFVAEAQDYEAATESLGVWLWSGTHTQPEVALAQAMVEELPTYRGLFWLEDGETRQPDDQYPQGVIEWIGFRAELCVRERRAR